MSKNSCKWNIVTNNIQLLMSRNNKERSYGKHFDINNDKLW
jgi:hypothetical protein